MKSALLAGVALFIIDPNNDFLGKADGSPYSGFIVRSGAGPGVMGESLHEVKAALPVKGATDALDRLAARIDAGGQEINDIIVTLDTHEPFPDDIDIGHPAYWRGKNGNQPAPFTTITLADVESGKWQPYSPLLLSHVLEYLRKVGYQVVWNRHCVDRTWGHQVYDPLAAALARWEKLTGRKVFYVRKGMNTGTEQYGAFEAAMPDPKDPSTCFNQYLLNRLRTNRRRKEVAGIATDFCVAATMRQAVGKLSSQEAEEFTLLTDAMAAVNLDGTTKAADDFIAEMQSKGLSVGKCESVPA